MRYSLAGGYQTNGENVSRPQRVRAGGHTALTGTPDQWRWSPDTVDGLAGQPGTPGDDAESRIPEGEHRVWPGTGTCSRSIQHFEGDYVELDTLPVIEDGMSWNWKGPSLQDTPSPGRFP